MRAFQVGSSIILFGLIPNNAGAQTISAPLALTSSLHNDIVEPSDYRWLRGRFADATAEDKQAFVAALQWNELCENQSRITMKAQLAARRNTFDPGKDVYAGSAPCRQFVQLPIAADVTWPAFSAALDRVRPFALGALRATALVDQQVFGQGDAEQLRTRPLGEQALRFVWIESQQHEGQTATYSPLERVVYEGILLRALDDCDQGNTAWLSTKVAHQGLPKRSKVVTRHPAPLGCLPNMRMPIPPSS